MLALLIAANLAVAPNGVAAPQLLGPPRVLSEPVGRPYIDLGPILLVEQRNDDMAAELALQAARLKADAFVLEGRELRDVYRLEREAWAARHPALSRAVSVAATVVAVAALILAGGGIPTYDNTPPSRVGERRYYRAIRFTDSPPATIDLARARLSSDTRVHFEGATDLGEQLGVAHALFVTGKLSPEQYAALRACLVGAAPCA